MIGVLFGVWLAGDKRPGGGFGLCGWLRIRVPGVVFSV